MTGLAEVPTAKVFVGNLNVRKKMGDIDELAKSIREKGIVEPLLVRPAGTRFEVVAGTRRFEAAKAAGLRSIPVISRDMSDDEAVIISLVENLQRHELRPEEEYDALMFLMNLKPSAYGTEEQLAKAISKSREHVSSVIRAVEVIRELSKDSRAKLEVAEAPPPKERREGRVLPLVHASMLASAEKAGTVQSLPRAERKEKLVELARTIAPLPQTAARKTVEHFVMNPKRTVQKIKEEALYSHPIKLEVHLEPAIADALTRAAEEKQATMERLAMIIIEEWLNRHGYVR